MLLIWIIPETARTVSQTVGRIENTLTAIEAWIAFTRENIRTTRSTETSLAAARRHSDVRRSNIALITEAIIRAKFGVASRTQCYTRIAFHAPSWRIAEAIVADFFTRHLITTIVAAFTAILRHTANSTCRCEVICSAFHCRSEWKS